MLQSQARNNFRSEGLPKNKSHGFDYVNLKPFFINLEKDVSKEGELPERKDNQIVIIDGEYCKELSSHGFRVEKQADCRLFEAYINKVGHEILAKSKNSLVSLNFSNDSDGIFVRIEKGFKSDTPIKIYNIVTKSGLKNLTNRIYFHCGAQSKLNLQLIHQSASDELVHNLVTHIQVEKEADIDITELTSDQFVGFHQLYVDVREKGNFKHKQVNFSPLLFRSDVSCYLREENSSVNLYGLNILQNSAQSHFFALVEHLAENTTSYQQVKNLCFDNSRTSFEGKIYVDPIAQQTKAYQLNQNLILSDKSANFSKPNLQILADDVKASHGSTFAKINEDELFYLQSRGIGKDYAKAMLVKSFVVEFLDQINDQALLEELEEIIKHILESKLCSI